MEWRDHAHTLRVQVDAFTRAVDGTRDHWDGDAADAARTKAEQITSVGNRTVETLLRAADAAQEGALRIGAARDAALRAVNAARGEGFDVADDGTATTSTAMFQTAVATDPATVIIAMAALESKAAEHSAAIKNALRTLGESDADVGKTVEAAFEDTVADSTSSAWPGRAVTGATAGLGQAAARTADDLMPSGAHAAVKGSVAERATAVDGLKIAGRASFYGGVVADAYGGYSDWKEGKATATEATAGAVGSFGGGAAGGALAGAAVGSFAGPIGTGVGAGLGAIIGSELGKDAALGLVHLFDDDD
ncbi:hypothetical protein [Rhodococcus sp. HNM0569]|uniref:hypothetical protein n=1 Tax=Rhodococcus sp. HNM0569 TaxID=2716340 RepID=UPI00146F8540|nr:hypothetical protein [Rhodococcus sp. HNM0569]NLU84719.1 hypothetical protein [Rhodococcus sp. HNM0569]